MFRVPDEATLWLCSLIVSLCFAVTFETVARRHRGRPHWRLWALANLTYSLGVIGFDLSAHPIAVAPAFFLYMLLAAGPLATAAGLDAFEGRRIPIGWGAAFALLPGIAYGVTPADRFGTTTLPQFAAGAGLAVSLGAAGLYLMLTPATRLATARRMLGLTMLANLPSYTSALALPLQPTGLFYIVAHYAWMSQPVLTLIANLTLLAIPILRANEELRRAALTDPLTGLHNRAWLAASDQAYAGRGGVLAALDLDGFKRVNDVNGHAAGDELLVRIAVSLQRWCARHGADAVRLGGDEFLIVMPGASEHLAADLRRHVHQDRLAILGVPQWSTSIGFAVYPADSPSLAEAMQVADKALYQDKAGKRTPAYARAA